MTGIHADSLDSDGRYQSIVICDCLPEEKADNVPDDHVGNMILIEHAPNDIAFLLDKVHDLQERIKELERMEG